MRASPFVILLLVFCPFRADAEVEKVTITSRAVIAEGKIFGAVGAYEKLVGRIDFALDPKEPHNAVIVDLEHATRGADGRVHFSSDLVVLRPVDPSKGNGVLFFEIANRGRLGLLGQFNGGGRGNHTTRGADYDNGIVESR